MENKKRNLILISFMLFSLFFGAGNLIFPPLLGQQAGNNAFWAMLGFLITAVVLPVLGVIVVGKFGGLTELAGKVGIKFAFIFTLLIYLSIGPGLGIPRAGSVPFEMAIAPYLSENANTTLWMLLYTLVFFLLVLWLCLNPGKLVKRIGTILTPSLLILIVVMFITFVFKMEKSVSDPDQLYETLPFLQGFVDGYQTMDTIAALNFGLVITLTLNSFGLKEEKSVTKYTILAGVFAGTILTIVYIMLSFMGSSTSGIYPNDPNGAVILRRIMYDLFGDFGAIFLAAIFTLACLTTCIGLTNSISSFFKKIFKKVSYKKWVFIIVIISFLICNLGLNMILSISIPILNAIYPVAIVLIILGLFNKFYKSNKFVYKLCVYPTFLVSIVYALDELFELGFITKIFSYIPMYQKGFGWVIVGLLMFGVSLLINFLYNKKQELDIKEN
ncbi:MAG: branched-chain amino acid transport system II carrier protein [Bacilli bacterium]|nr:branched-chain amino acid transport system II carrier protein [Bacilli bacterium]